MLPRPTYSRLSGRVLHDRVADRVAAAISALPHATATIVPFQLGRPFVRVESLAAPGAGPAAGGGVTPAPRRPETAAAEAAAAAAASRGAEPRRPASRSRGRGGRRSPRRGGRCIDGTTPGAESLACRAS